MNEELFQKVLLCIKTTHDLEFLSNKIDELTTALYTIDQKRFDQFLSSELPSEMSAAFQDTLKEKQINWNDPSQVKELLAELKPILASMTVLTLTVAFSPSDEAINRFAHKAKELFGLKTVLEINTQESLIGGAVIVYKGKYLDFSLQNKIKHVFQTNRKEILSLLS